MRMVKREINWCKPDKGLGKVKSEEKRERKGVGPVIHNTIYTESDMYRVVITMEVGVK